MFSKIFKKCYIELLCICTTIPETENLIIIDLICPNTDPDNYFSRKIMWPRENDQLIPDQIWSEFVDNFKECPHVLSGETLRATSIGTNPYVFTDYDRKVFYNDDGLPLGSNSDIISNIGKVLGFNVTVNLSSTSLSYFDNSTQKWVGLTGDVII